MFNWNEVGDDNKRIPSGQQVIRLYSAYDSSNVNGKKFIAVKGGLPEDVQISMVAERLDNFGKLLVYPHGMINFYYETDFGKSALKNLLKAIYGDDITKYDTPEKICEAIRKDMPMVQVDVVESGKFTNFKEFTFEPVVDADDYKMAKPTQAPEKGIDPDEPVQEDLPF
jgi:hypothetical protein